MIELFDNHRKLIYGEIGLFACTVMCLVYILSLCKRFNAKLIARDSVDDIQLSFDKVSLMRCLFGMLVFCTVIYTVHKMSSLDVKGKCLPNVGHHFVVLYVTCTRTIISLGSLGHAMIRLVALSETNTSTLGGPSLVLMHLSC